LLNRTVQSGWHSLAWDGRNNAGRQVASGLYILNMSSSSQRKAIIMHMLK
jgi:flagellar hook assembly protein FlgD